MVKQMFLKASVVMMHFKVLEMMAVKGSACLLVWSSLGGDDDWKISVFWFLHNGEEDAGSARGLKILGVDFQVFREAFHKINVLKR